jgi:chromosome segregation ATPase
VKDDLSEKSQSPSFYQTENLKNIESLLMKIQKIEEKQFNQSENSEILQKNHQKLGIFNEIFEIIIENDRIFGKYLKAVKEFYELYNDQEMKKQLKILQKLEDEKNSLSQERESFQRLLENLSRENFKLSKEIDSYEEEIEQLHQELKNVQNMDFEPLPTNKDSWKYVLKQNKYYKEKYKNIQSEVQVYKHNQEIFIRKFEELKEQGIDVYYEYAEEGKSSSRGSVVLLELPKSLKKSSSKVPGLKINNISNFP